MAIPSPRRGRRLALVALVALLGARSDGARVLEVAPEGGPAGTGAPEYDARGALRRPEGYQEWTFVGASLGLSYAEGAAEGTVLVLELHEAAQKVAPSRHGLFEGRRVAVEAAVKDSTRFPEGWAYYSFGDGSQATATAFPRGACFECHRQHAARDNVFVQFYPVLRDGRH